MKRSRPLVSNHEQVYRALRSAHSPMTAYQILDAVRPEGISAPPTVYRALGRLVEEGLAHRLESINSYVACANPHHHHDAAVFAICSDCGAIEELFDASVLKRLRARASERGFKVNQTTIELKGQCAACQPSAARS
jgi:Fur family transcriptional regulator, zinc uptake regulator